MDLWKQCQLWFDQHEVQKIIDTLEAIPAGERTPELDSELARAYIAIAKIGERELYEKALELLKPHEEHFAEDHCWNYRIASAYYYLDEEGPALRYFERALNARPGDKDTQEYIDDCRHRLALPRFEKNFRERAAEAWAAFTRIEAELRQIMDADKTHQRGEELIETCGNALKTALRDTSFELGFNGEKYELILSPEGLRSHLFPLVYFQRRAPQSVLEHWNIWVGRQPSKGFMFRAGAMEVRAEDVQMWAEKTGDGHINLVLYCKKLVPLLNEDADRVWWALSMLLDQVIGEVSSIAFVAGFDIYAQPKDEPAMLLSQLPELLQTMGFSLWRDGRDYLENSYVSYELEPVEDPEADWRLDVYTGICRLPVLINDYMTARNDLMDEYHRDGIAAGFLLYPLSGFTGEARSKNILDFRDALQEAILHNAGAEAVTFLGGATGLYHGYLDFIAWDLPAVLAAAQAFLEESGLPYAHFHTFRRDVGGVPLLDEEEPEPDIHEETGSLLSAEDIKTLESFDEGTSGYFGKMLRWLKEFIESGVKEGKFTEKQARQDLQIALWYAFACNNLDDYIHYYQAAEWMKDSEKNAAGCAAWYYRYSVALMYCGRLEEALSYAEAGAQQEPDYPWIWLQVGKLRAHFGNKAGALDAVKQGLILEPNDYEFLTLQQEIHAGATLEQMEYHWINPEADAALQSGNDADADDKQRALACMRADEAGLADFYALFHPERYDYEKNSPCCEFHYPVDGHSVELSFRMNEAGLSKLGTDWLRKLKNWLDSGEWLTYPPAGGSQGTLAAVFVDQTRRMGLVYRQPENGRHFQIFREANGSECNTAWFENHSEANGAEDEAPADLKGSFAGFVLLSEPSWDKQQLIRDLKEKWNIIAQEEEDNGDDTLIFTLDNCMVAVSMVPAPIPDGEAEANAANNYLWPEAVEAAKTHQAHMMVAVIGEEEQTLEIGKLHVKVLSACCRQTYATGIYTSGVVLEPQFYEEFANMMKADMLPIFNWIWFGLYESERGLCGYTDGLEQFGRDEIEVLNTNAQPKDLRAFLISLASYVLENNLELHDGETIGFSEEDKHSITRSEGEVLPGMTLKISYSPMD